MPKSFCSILLVFVVAITVYSEQVSYLVHKDSPDDFVLNVNVSPVAAQLSGFFLYPTSVKAEYTPFPFLSLRTGGEFNIFPGSSKTFDPNNFSANAVNLIGVTLGVSSLKKESIKIVTGRYLESRGSSSYDVQKYINLPVTTRKRTGLFLDFTLSDYPSYVNDTINFVKDSFYQASVTELCMGISRSKKKFFKASLGNGNPFVVRTYSNSYYGFIYGLGGEFNGSAIEDKAYMGFRLMWEGNVPRWNWLTYQLEVYTAAFFYQKTDTTLTAGNEPSVSKQLMGDAPKAYVKIGFGISPPIPFVNKMD